MKKILLIGIMYIVVVIALLSAMAMLEVIGVPSPWGGVLVILVFLCSFVFLMKFIAIKSISYADVQPVKSEDIHLLTLDRLRDLTQALEALGFVRVADRRVRPKFPSYMMQYEGHFTFVRLFIHPVEGCYATIAQPFLFRRPRRMACSVISVFEDGRSLSTSQLQAADLGYSMRRPKRLWRSRPNATPAELLADHWELRKQISDVLVVEVCKNASLEHWQELQATLSEEQMRLVWRRSIVRMLIESILCRIRPEVEWLGDYAKIAAHRRAR
jgi:hypothetical protein